MKTPAPTILVCDHDAAAVEHVRELLEPRGYRLLSASSGPEAIATAARERPAAILLELLMPRMSGWRVASTLKGQPETADIPIIVTSVLGPAENPLAEDPAVTREIVARIRKPVDDGSLLVALEQVIGRSPPRS